MTRLCIQKDIFQQKFCALLQICNITITVLFTSQERQMRSRKFMSISQGNISLHCAVTLADAALLGLKCLNQTRRGGVRSVLLIYEVCLAVCSELNHLKMSFNSKIIVIFPPGSGRKHDFAHHLCITLFMSYPSPPPVSTWGRPSPTTAYDSMLHKYIGDN